MRFAYGVEARKMTYNKERPGPPVDRASAYALAEWVAGERHCFLDVETTGLHPSTAYVIQIGVVDEEGKSLLNVLVNPPELEEMPEESYRVHGITLDMLRQGGIEREEAMRQVKAICEERVLVTYNAEFDTSMLVAEMMRVRDLFPLRRVCMMNVAQAWCGMERRPRLHHGAFNTAGAHSALEDARLTHDLMENILRGMEDPWQMRPVRDLGKKDASGSEGAAS